jgi:hypothetical protein
MMRYDGYFVLPNIPLNMNVLKIISHYMNALKITNDVS